MKSSPSNAETSCEAATTMPSGVAQGQNLPEVYRAARDCDSRAAFGGVAVVNRALDAKTAEAMLEGFLEEHLQVQGLC